MNLLTNIVRDYLASDGWEIGEIQQPNISMILLSKLNSESTPDSFRVRIDPIQGKGMYGSTYIPETGSVEIRVHETKIEFCHVIVDVHNPNSLAMLSYCLKICTENKQCFGCPVYRKFYSLLKDDYPKSHN